MTDLKESVKIFMVAILATVQLWMCSFLLRRHLMIQTVALVHLISANYNKASLTELLAAYLGRTAPA